jgi:hypothetical protein
VQRQQQLLRVLQRIGSQLPGLLQLLASQSPAAAAAAGAIAGAGGGAGEAMEVEGAGAVQGLAAAQQQQQQRQQEAALPGSREQELESVLSDLVQLPELAQGLPVLLTAEQHQQRQLQLQHLARRAVGMVGPEDGSAAGSAAAGNAGAGAEPTGPAAAQLGGVAPATVPAAASTPREIQASLLFSSILASLGAAGGATGGPVAIGSAAGGPPSRVQGRLGAGISQLGALPGSAAASAGIGNAAVGGGAAAGSGLPPGLQTGPLGLLGAGGAPGPADGLMAAALGHPAAAAAASGSTGMFTPTGVGAMLSGGLLAEGGVAGDSILEDMAADMLLYGGRRITCHGMYELCAALAGHGSPPHPQPEQPADAQAAGVSDSPAAEAEAAAGCGLAGQKRRMSSSGAEEQPARKR